MLIFKCTEGGGGRNPRPLSSFDTHARWQPVTQSARSRPSYGKTEDCDSLYAGLLAVLCQRVITTLWYSLLAGSCFSSCWWLVDLWGPTADLPEPFVMETFCSIKLPHTDGRFPQTSLQHKQTEKKANYFTVRLKFQPSLSYRLSPKEEQMYYFLDLKPCSSEAVIIHSKYFPDCDWLKAHA